MDIFKAYDIRGIYPTELAEAESTAIGWAIGEFLKSLSNKRIKVVVGYDVRLSSLNLSKALIKGLQLSGAEVTLIGQVTTPMTYFASGFYGFDGSVMVTASHNPAEYNGFKVCRENAIALSQETGLQEIKKLYFQFTPARINQPRSPRLTTLDIKQDYKKFILKFLNVKRPLRVVVDTANGSVGPIFEYIFRESSIDYLPLYFRPDGHFPNHEPNPLKPENLATLKDAILNEKADFGVGFDGDGDRCIFLDEQGNQIRGDFITALLAREILKSNPGAPIVYDLRSSWIVSEEIKSAGGKPIRERVGHPYIKQTMRKYNAPFGGELSGHYYFRENYFADSGLLAFVHFLNAISRENKPVSEIVKPFQKYFATGEINFIVEDKDAKIDQIARVFQDGKQDFLDGITIEYPDWWCNIRKSNTEPLLRLNLEAKTRELMEQAKQRLEQLLNPSATYQNKSVMIIKNNKRKEGDE